MNQLSMRRSDPFSALVDDVFSDFFQRAGVTPARGGEGTTVARARMDVIDRGDQFEIRVDLPGVSKEDINVSVEGARVTLQAESRKQKETKDGERVLYSERTFTGYARSFENGVLTLALPKRVTVAGRRLAVR